jgi:hypothetical protein
VALRFQSYKGATRTGFDTTGWSTVVSKRREMRVGSLEIEVPPAEAGGV